MYGVAFSILSDLGKPSMDDVMKSVNTAIDDLARDMNQRLDQMRGYVDTRVINSEKNLLNDKYR